MYSSTVTAELARQLTRWRPTRLAQASLRDEYLDYIQATGPTALDRTARRSHVTASCFVFNADLSAILLCFHKKGRFWVQLGGHIEPADLSVSGAAFREATEEAGVAVVPLSHEVLDVDRHSLDSGFARCDVHWDIGYGAIADPAQQTVANDESDDVRWWPTDALPAEVPRGFVARIERILAAANLHSTQRATDA